MASYFVLFVIFFSIFSPRFQFFFRIFPFCLFVAASSSLLFGSDCFRLHYCVNVCAGCIFFSLFERSDIHSPNTPEVGNKEKYRKGKNNRYRSRIRVARFFDCSRIVTSYTFVMFFLIFPIIYC